MCGHIKNIYLSLHQNYGQHAMWLTVP